jgi:hypothetical protein
MNPPTIGHEKLANTIERVARKERATPLLYLSHSQDKKKNPLDYNTKIRIARKAFGNMVTKSTSRNIIEILKEVQNKGFDAVTVVAGQDRVKEFENLINKYNGKEYTFDNIEVVSAGARDPDAEGVEGMSASKLRNVAKKGDLETFKKGMPKKLSDADKEAVYNAIRQFGEDYNPDEEDDFLTDDDIEDMLLYMEDEDWKDILDDAFDLDEEVLDEAPLSISQRLKRGRIARRYAKRTQRKREIKLRRRAGSSDLKKRARRGAIKLLKKKVAGKKGANYAALSPSQKISVDKAVQKRMSQVDRISRRLLPDVKRKETERLRNRGKSRNESFDLVENVTHQQLKDLEKFADRLFKKFDIDIEFSKHFADRMNDSRNSPDIKISELQALFKKIAKNKAKNIIKHKGSQVVLKDMQKDLNLPIVIKVDGEEIDVVHKTIMRKKNFTTPNPVVQYEDFELEENVISLKKNNKRVVARKSKDGQYVLRFMDGNQVTDLKKLSAVAAKSHMKGLAMTGWEKTESIDEAFEGFLAEQKYIEERNTKALEDKAKAFGYEYETILEVYNRGISDYSKVSKPDLSESQWAWARVNSFIAGGAAAKKDADLIESLGEEKDPCWKGYRQYGMKKKDGKEVPNCVPEEGGAGEEGTTKLTKRYKKDTPGEKKMNEGEYVDREKEEIRNEKERMRKRNDARIDLARIRDTRMKNKRTESKEPCCEECAAELNETVYEISESEYQGKNVELNKPFRANDGKHDKCVYVKNDKGNVVKVCFGDSSMKNKSDDSARRKSFRARHKCDNPGPKWKARYWACKNW